MWVERCCRERHFFDGWVFSTGAGSDPKLGLMRIPAAPVPLPALSLGSSGNSAAVTLSQVDTFSGGTAGWGERDPRLNPPIVADTGLVGGAYLRSDSAHLDPRRGIVVSRWRNEGRVQPPVCRHPFDLTPGGASCPRSSTGRLEWGGTIRYHLPLRQRISAAEHGRQFHATLATSPRRSLRRGTGLLGCRSMEHRRETFGRM